MQSHACLKSHVKNGPITSLLGHQGQLGQLGQLGRHIKTVQNNRGNEMSKNLMTTATSSMSTLMTTATSTVVIKMQKCFLMPYADLIISGMSHRVLSQHRAYVSQLYVPNTACHLIDHLSNMDIV